MFAAYSVANQCLYVIEFLLAICLNLESGQPAGLVRLRRKFHRRDVEDAEFSFISFSELCTGNRTDFFQTFALADAF